MKTSRMGKLKPLLVAKCKHRNNCYNYETGDCRGCNIWNYLYDEKAVIEWCRKHNEDVSMFTLKMHKELYRSRRMTDKEKLEKEVMERIIIGEQMEIDRLEKENRELKLLNEKM